MNAKFSKLTVVLGMVSLGLLVMVSGCANKAQKEAETAIAKAESDLNVAKESMADKYAVAAFKNAETSLTDAKDAMTKKNYPQALVYAQDSTEKSEAAVRESMERRSAEKKGPVVETPKRSPRTLK